MRKLSVLYGLVLTRLIEDKKEEKSLFICNIIGMLFDEEVITKDEMIILKNHFESQKPSETKHKNFLKSENWYGRLTWWVYNEYDERVKFLKLMIRITKKIENENR